MWSLIGWRGQETLYYCTALPFFLFYLLFDLVLYPFKDHLHPDPNKMPQVGNPETSGVPPPLPSFPDPLIDG